MRKHLAVLHPDDWLAAQLRRPCYRLDFAGDPDGGLRDQVASLPSERTFVYARIPCAQTKDAVALQEAGFRVVDVNLNFVKAPGTPVRRDVVIRNANSEDEEAVALIAGSAFQFSRFHLDPAFEQGEADGLKREWARNFFRGGRGDGLFVAVHAGQIAGFLLLIKVTGACVIDLIAVSKEFQGMGFGAAMIACCEKSFEGVSKISTGTQAANAASVRFYEGLGFRLREAQYILHWHK